METYRLSSKVVENEKEFLIQTSNDAQTSMVRSTVFVNGDVAETTECPHPTEITPEEVLSLVKTTHSEKQKEVEMLVRAYSETISGGNPDLAYHLGCAFYYKRMFAESRELFQVAVMLQSDHHAAFSFLGMAESSLGHVEEAVRAGEAAVKHQPGYADYLNNLGEAYLAAGRHKAAVNKFEQALRINLYYADAYFNLGLALLSNAIHGGDHKLYTDILSKASDYFKKATLIDARYESARLEEALAALNRADLKEALEKLQKIRSIKLETHRQEFANYYLKFVLYPDWVSEEALDDRIQFLESEIQKNPGYVDLYSDLANCHLQQARVSWQKGMAQMKKAAEINPSLKDVQFDLKKAEETLSLLNSSMMSMTKRA